MLNALIMVLMFLTATFLILLVLIQRGRGGGLAGAFGGLGGQSAFGTKAGDLFTRITIGVAAFWIILCATSVKLLSDQDKSRLDVGPGETATVPPVAGGAPKAADSAPGAAGPKTTPSAPTDSGPDTEAPAATAPAESTSDTKAPDTNTPSTTAPAGDDKSAPPK